MTVLLHMSDPHFGTIQPPVAQALARLAQAQRPDVLVLSGDITQRARPQQFKEARAFCDQLAIAHLLTVPGNHDIPLFNVYQRLFTPYARYLQCFGPALQTCLDLPQFLLLGVNTTRRWRHKNGEVSVAQIDRVAAQLRSAGPAQLRVVVVHQPVYVMRAEDEHDRLRGWESAVRAWTAAGADLVLGGHIHLPYVCELSSRVAGLGRRLWCVQAGTALSSRVRWEAPNSVNLLRYDAASVPLQCQSERWDYLAAVQRFEKVETRALLLDR